MPIEAIMFNPRLTGQARQLWTWLASKDFRQGELSWTQCEFFMNCGTTARRRSLAQLQEEGFVTVSSNGGVITMHDPFEAYKESRQSLVNQICDECSELRGEKVESKPVAPKTQTVAKNTFDEKKEIIDAWNACKPESYAKIRVLSNKQKECVNKHLLNLGLKKTEIKELICSVCRGLAQEDFWIKQIDSKSRNFNAVFGYGSPNDKKMKNIENLYLSGDPEHVPVDENKPVKYTEEQQEVIELIKKLDYQISMQNPEDLEQDYVQKFIKMRDQAMDKLDSLGIVWESM